MFDRGVPLVAPDLAAFLVLQMDALSELAVPAGRETERARWRRAADELCRALLAELWHGDRFVAKLGCTGQIVDSRSLIPCVPIVLGERLPEPVRTALACRIGRYLTDWGLATEPPDSECYEPDGYWRGPIWAPSTHLIVCGLRQCGFHSQARTIAERFCRLCSKSGFAENYDALTGAPLRDPSYTWTASVYLLLAELLAAEPFTAGHAGRGTPLGPCGAPGCQNG
jgi:glycogen debranching enzyme